MILCIWMPTESNIHAPTWKFTLSRRNWIYIYYEVVNFPTSYLTDDPRRWVIFIDLTLGFWHIRTYIYIDIYIYICIDHKYNNIHNIGYTNYLHILANMKCFFPEFCPSTTINSMVWGPSALDKRRPCIRKWPRLWLGKDRKVMRFVPSVENRYLQMMQSIHAASGNDDQYNDYILYVIIFIYSI